MCVGSGVEQHRNCISAVTRRALSPAAHLEAEGAGDCSRRSLTRGLLVAALTASAHAKFITTNDKNTLDVLSEQSGGSLAAENFTNKADNVVIGNVLMNLSDGTTFAGTVGSESSFYGWVSEGDVRITSVTYRPFHSGTGSFASLSDLGFALIPSSGAMAILALGGFMAVRSRP